MIMLDNNNKMIEIIDIYGNILLKMEKFIEIR